MGAALHEQIRWTPPQFPPKLTRSLTGRKLAYLKWTAFCSYSPCTQKHSWHTECPSLWWTLISLHVKEPTKGFFFFFLHAHLQCSSEAAKHNLPLNLLDCQKAPNIISTIYGVNNNSIVTSSILAGAPLVLCFILRSKSLGRLQLGRHQKYIAILYLDRHDNQNAAIGGIISLCLLAHPAHYIFCFDLLRLQMFPWSLNETHIWCTYMHSCM